MFASTLRAIGAPRRLIPVAVVAVGLFVAELANGGGPTNAAYALGMCAAFVAVAPASWRALFGGQQHHSLASWALRLVAYGALGGMVVGLGSWVPLTLGGRASLLSDPPGVPVTLVLFWVGGWGLGRDVELELSLRRAERRGDEAQLLAMRHHLDPHFLFNTLNAIAEWCQHDPAVAEQATLRLASMLRVVFDGIREERWPLEREIDLVRDLWALHHARDPERFRAHVVTHDVARATVPPLLLLPLAENAMTHGVWRGGRGEVRLEVERCGERVRATIDSPGAYRPHAAAAPAASGEGDTSTSPGTGSGLSMVRDRLRLAYGPHTELTIGPSPDDGERTRVVVSFPAGAA